jgi:predicted Rossmann fold flavoprotein
MESTQPNDLYDLAVIGGGAAGMMAAASAIETNPNARVIVIDRNHELGKKVKRTGGGRCNVTTGIQDVKTVLTKYPRGGKFLTSAMHAFPPSAMMEWIESHGVPLKVEDSMRVFPASEKSEDIVDIFKDLFKASNVEVSLGVAVTKVERRDDGSFLISRDGRSQVHARSLVIATGGQTYRDTGSTGDGYAFAQAFGHTITPLAPSLSSLMTDEVWPADVSGLAFQGARLSASSPKIEAEGGFIFTHKGISGPAVFALSAQLAFVYIHESHPLEVSIDLFQGQSIDELRLVINQHIEQNPKKQIVTILSYIVPKSLSEVICRELKLDDSLHAIELSKKERLSIVSWLKAIPLHVIDRGAGDEFVTAGGIDTHEVDPKTMESKIVPNLYLAGELLDVDGYTGGFNLQACWSTGRSAGIHVAEKL